MILGATLLSDRKLYSIPIGLKALIDAPEVESLYVNVETDVPALYANVEMMLAQSGKSYAIDYWSIHQSNRDWRPAYDQDPKRLQGICTGRNMALEYALFPGFSHLLFIDSDVYPHPGSIQKVIDVRKSIAGGLVPGRGAHSGVFYLFGERERVGSVSRCAHGTCGFMLIARSVYEVLRFRTGPHPVTRGTWLSEDPCYAADAEFMKLSDGWWIDREAVADHIDNPLHPLTEDEAINDYFT
jgi:glycosyltransferase involved in cell wall biosynthesis